MRVDGLSLKMVSADPSGNLLATSSCSIQDGEVKHDGTVSMAMATPYSEFRRIHTLGPLL